jgi:hypothetical protein
MLRETSGNVVTAHVRQIEIQKQDRRHELDGESKSTRAGIRDTGITVPRRLQQRRESIGRNHIVIDNQYARHTAPGTAFALRPGWGRWMRSHEVRSAKAHQTRVLVARLEAPNLPSGFVARDATSLFNLTRNTYTAAGNQVEMSGGGLSPVFAYFVPEALRLLQGKPREALEAFGKVRVAGTGLQPKGRRALRDQDRPAAETSDLFTVLTLRGPEAARVWQRLSGRPLLLVPCCCGVCCARRAAAGINSTGKLFRRLG